MNKIFEQNKPEHRSRETVETPTLCPCGNRMESDEFPVCLPCWLTAPDYFRIKYNSKIPFRVEQARNQIRNHARRRAAK